MSALLLTAAAVRDLPPKPKSERAPNPHAAEQLR